MIQFKFCLLVLVHVTLCFYIILYQLQWMCTIHNMICFERIKKVDKVNINTWSATLTLYTYYIIMLIMFKSSTATNPYIKATGCLSVCRCVPMDLGNHWTNMFLLYSLDSQRFWKGLNLFLGRVTLTYLGKITNRGH